MTKEEIITLMKEYKMNKAKLQLCNKEKSKLIKKLDNNIENEISLGSSGDINSFIQSKNSYSDKVGNTVVKAEKRHDDIEKKIKDLDKEIGELQNKLDEVDIRLNALYYKEREIVKDFYIENRSAVDIGTNVYPELFRNKPFISEQSLYNIRDKAVDLMARLDIHID